MFFSFHYNRNAQQQIHKLHQFTDTVIYIANHIQTIDGSGVYDFITEICRVYGLKFFEFNRMISDMYLAAA